MNLIMKPESMIKQKMTAIIVFGFLLFASILLFGSSPRVNAGNYLNSPTGEELFKANCARCHGSSGEGGKGPNLTTEKKKSKWKDSDTPIVKQITKGGFFMPSFRKKLSEAEIRSIAAYVRQLTPVSK